MDSEDLGVVAASQTAERLLDALGDRWGHVRAVAARAWEITPAIDVGDRELLVMAAWLHDIGYGPRLKITGLHPLDGARYLEALDYPRRLVCLVAHHSCARYEAEERGLADELAVYELEESPVMDAIIAADMTIGPGGAPVSFVERIEEILRRYPADSPVHRAIVRARPELAGAVERTQQRLADVGLTSVL